jgi:LPS-assembly lipoprotein
MLLGLSACGFQIIYKEEKSNQEETSYAEELAAVRIQKMRNKMGQDIKNSLYDVLNPDYLKVDPKYFLVIEFTKSVSATFITETGASGRNKITLGAKYTLKSLENGNTISTGSTIANDNYDVTRNRFGTIVAEDYVSSNLTTLIAQNIRNSLVNDFIEVRKKCRGEFEVDQKETDEQKDTTEVFVCPLDTRQAKAASKAPEAPKDRKKSTKK